MRMAPLKLFDKALNHILYGKSPVAGRDLRVKHHVEQNVAEILHHVRVVPFPDRIHKLAHLFPELREDGAMGLLFVPGAPAGALERREDALEFREPPIRLRSSLAHGTPVLR